ncbi:ABC transporter permease [Planococcus sp. N064]|uniref:ABC transporter permease n=1 Tax=Planococcus liqunii TaxID=3058394 RepID=A0ABT8MP99_9BACL|nr:ABC transporter permease [Planococcus sp. N064]MDN7226722.1 ABC transporter permease [Planococcus sp. N064]
MKLFLNLFVFYSKQLLKSPFYMGTLIFMVGMLLIRIVLGILEPFDYMRYGSFVGEMMMIVQAVLLLLIVYFYKAFSNEFRFGASNLFMGSFRVTLLKIGSLFSVHALFTAACIGLQFVLISLYFRLSGIPYSSFYTQTLSYLTVYWYLPFLLAFCLGILTALLFGKHKLGLVFMIVVWLVIGPMNTTLFHQYFHQIPFSDPRSLLYIGPLSSESPFIDLLGYNVSLAAYAKIIFWLLAVVLLMALILMKTTRTSWEKLTLALLCLSLVLVNTLLFPHIFTGGKLAFSFADLEAEAQYYKDIPDEMEPVFLQYEVEDYAIQLDARGPVTAQTTVALSDIRTATLGFVLYHGFEVTQVTDQQGQTLPFTDQGDFVFVERDGERLTDQLTFSYNLNDSALVPVSEDYLFLPNAFSWIPTQTNHPPFIFDTLYDEGVDLHSVQTDQVIPYTLTVEGDLPLYTNLAADGKNRYSGEVAGGVSVLGGMLTETDLGEQTVLHPNSWSDISADWKIFEPSLARLHQELLEMFHLDAGELPNQIALLALRQEWNTGYLSSDHLLYFSGSNINISSTTHEIPGIYLNALLWNHDERLRMSPEQILVFNEMLTLHLQNETGLVLEADFTPPVVPSFIVMEKHEKEIQTVIAHIYADFYSMEKNEQTEFLVLWHKEMEQVSGSWLDTAQLLQEFKGGKR